MKRISCKQIKGKATNANKQALYKILWGKDAPANKRKVNLGGVK